MERMKMPTYHTPGALDAELNAESTCSECAERGGQDPQWDEGYRLSVNVLILKLSRLAERVPPIIRTKMLGDSSDQVLVKRGKRLTRW